MLSDPVDVEASVDVLDALFELPPQPVIIPAITEPARSIAPNFVSFVILVPPECTLQFCVFVLRRRKGYACRSTAFLLLRRRESYDTLKETKNLHFHFFSFVLFFVIYIIDRFLKSCYPLCFDFSRKFLMDFIKSYKNVLLCSRSQGKAKRPPKNGGRLPPQHARSKLTRAGHKIFSVFSWRYTDVFFKRTAKMHAAGKAKRLLDFTDWAVSFGKHTLRFPNAAQH
jgi:hypothetical protein